MRIFTLGESERSAWPITGASNGRFFSGSGIVRAETSAEGIPACADHGLGETVVVLPAAGGNTYLISEFLSTKRARVRFWSYLAGASVTGNSALIRVFNGNLKIRFDIATPRVDDNTISVAMRAYNDSGAGAIIMPSSSPYAYDVDAPIWLHHDIEWTAQTASGVTDGTMRHTISDWHDGALRTLKTSSLTGQATGVTPIDRMFIVAYYQNFGDGGMVVYGDLSIDDVFASEADHPGVLMPFIHSPDPEAGTCRIRLVCDRPIAHSKITYTGGGVVQDAIPVALNETDGDRWVEHHLSNLQPGVEYTWDARLVGADGTAGTITTLDESDPQQCKFTPIPLDYQRVSITSVNDSHLTRKTVAQFVNDSQSAAPGGDPDVLVWLGDNISIQCSTDANAPTVDVLRQWLGINLEYRALASRMISLCLIGAHELTDFVNAGAKTFAALFTPQVVESGAELTRMRYGPVEFFALHLSSATEAQGLALINGAFADAIASTTAPHVVCVTHSHGEDAPSTGSPGREAGLAAANSAALHVVLREAGLGGHRVYHLHGHLHAGGWWVKDGVVYVTSPCRQLWKPKDYASGEYNYPAGGDPGSIKASIRGYGERGASGFLCATFGSRHSRWQVLDGYVTGDPGVYSDKRMFERIVGVAPTPGASSSRTVVLTFSNLNADDVVRVRSRNIYSRVIDDRRYQFSADGSALWGHTGINTGGDYGASECAVLFEIVADTTAITWGSEGPVVTGQVNADYELLDVSIYNAATWVEHDRVDVRVF